MPNVFATPDDCNSELGKKMQQWRSDRPDEWTMDEFIREVEKLDAAFKAAKAYIDSSVCDPDITDEMIDAYEKYQDALEQLRG